MSRNRHNGKQPFALLMNDPHIDKDNIPLVEYIFDQAFDICDSNELEYLFVGGDLFTNRSGQPLKCLLSFSKIVEEAKRRGIVIHIIPGNHDKTNPDDLDSYLDVYKSDHVVVYRDACYQVFDNECTVGFIPYFTDELWLEKFEKLQKKQIIKKGVSFLIAHSGFDGVPNNDGSKVSSVIKPSIFAKYTKVLVGHYHNASKLGDNVIYTGSCYQNNFGETWCDKGFTLLFSDGDTKFIQSVFPRYIKEVLDAKDKQGLKNIIDKYVGEDGIEDDFLRIVFTGKKTDFENINKDELQGWGIDVKFQADEATEAIENAEMEDTLVMDKKTIKKEFIKFCSEYQIKGEDLKYGLDLMKLL
jgi:DNA repair exonuclease SbcCD nuclease subunit